MNKMELLCWDTWELGDRGPDDEVTAEEVALLDRVAALTQAGNEVFAELRSVYESNVCLRVPPVIKSYTKKGLRLVNIADSQ